MCVYIDIDIIMTGHMLSNNVNDIFHNGPQWYWAISIDDYWLLFWV